MSESNMRDTLLVPGSILVGAVIIGVSLIIGLSHTGGAANTDPSAGSAAPAQAVNIKDVKQNGDPYIGQVSAPVSMAYWSDYQCPFCKAFEVGGVPQINGQNNTTPAAMPQIIKQYVDTGKLKIVFKDFQFLGNDSTTGAEYARAIWHLYPSQWYDWRMAMYRAQDQEGDQGFGNAATIDTLIKSTFPQMNDAKIKADIAANQSAYDAAITADRTEGEKFGVNGTPGFIIGTQLIDGFSGFSVFQTAINAELK